ncbi:MAG: TIGR04219 family outer membrane beta-barrel protein [Psychromonas sp.]
MKKILLVSLIASASLSVSADMLIGGDIEMNFWQQNQTVNGSDSGSSEGVTFEGSIEHFIPLIPNLKFAQSSVDGDDLEYTKRDYTLYYELLDNDLASVDVGFGLTQFSDSKVFQTGAWQDFDGYLPHVYAAAEIGVAGTPFFFFAKGLGFSYSDNTMYDASVGVKYVLPLVAFDLDLQAGYRMQHFDFDDFDDVEFDSETDGLYAGVNIDF